MHVHTRLLPFVVLLALALLVMTGPAGASPAPLGAESIHLPIRSHDGVILDGWVHLPARTAGQRVPVVVAVSPYYGSYGPTANDLSEGQRFGGSGMSMRRFAERGYAVALYSSRGSGNSGGCLDMVGPNEQADMTVVVEALADAPWSTGAVAAVGKSYPGNTALAAAARAPRGLRAVVGLYAFPDGYTNWFTPQGAAAYLTPHSVLYHALTAPPPIDRTGASLPDTATRYPVVAGDAVCEDVRRHLRAAAVDVATDDRDAQFWQDRDLVDELRDSPVPVFASAGFHDTNVWNNQEGKLWDAISNRPARMVLAQGGHTWPRRAAFDEEVLDWVDHWVKGTGAPPVGLGTVDFQDDQRRWHRAATWPASPRDETLRLVGRELTRRPGNGDRTFRSVGDPHRSWYVVDETDDEGPNEPVVCPYPGAAEDVSAAAWVSSPATDELLVAGSPQVRLQVTSDQPGGIVEANLYAVPPDGCDDVRYWGSGAADLRFHKNRYHGSDFPVGRRTEVRIDLPHLAETLRPGERLLLVLNRGGSLGQAYAPRITVHGGTPGSRLVLPVVTG